MSQIVSIVNKNCVHVAQNVLIETTSYLVMIRCLLVVYKFAFLDVVMFNIFFFVKACISKTIYLRYVFEKVPSAK